MKRLRWLPSYMTVAFTIMWGKYFGTLDISWSTVAIPFVFIVGVYLGSLSSIFHKRLGG